MEQIKTTRTTYRPSGPAGIDFCLAALRDSHTLTLYVRNLAKLPPEIANNVTIVTGQLTDASAVEKAVSGGAKTCVSFLGPVLDKLKKGERVCTFLLLSPIRGDEPGSC